MDSLNRVYIALGSNLPDRSAHLKAGRDMLRRVSAGGWVESPIYETPPVGPAGQGAVAVPELVEGPVEPCAH